MVYFLIFLLLGAGGGAASVYVALMNKRRWIVVQKKRVDAEARRTNEAARTLKAREREAVARESDLAMREQELNKRTISYTELWNENRTLKRDLQNVDVNLRKLMLDRELQAKAQTALDERCQELGGRYLKENVKWIGSSLTANNFAVCKQRLLEVVQRCRGVGLAVPDAQEAGLVADLKAEFERLVRASLEREEQARIKAQIREERKLEKEIEREVEQAEREQVAIQAALNKALAEAKDQHSAEVERLKARLAEAEQKAQRAKSRAEMTRSGYVYVISNVGSLGDGVFKIGMTRRLEPLDRVRELGDASVPFPFDVHMMVSCDDAPKLENALHRALHKTRLNKIKPRKEFYRSDLESIRRIVIENHGEVDYVADAEALQYRQSLDMSDEDAEYIEQVYKAEEDEGGEAVPDDA